MEKNNTDEQKSISLSPKKEKKWPKPHHGKQERTRNENPSFHNSKNGAILKNIFIVNTPLSLTSISQDYEETLVFGTPRLQYHLNSPQHQ